MTMINSQDSEDPAVLEVKESKEEFPILSAFVEKRNSMIRAAKETKTPEFFGKDKLCASYNPLNYCNMCYNIFFDSEKKNV